MGVSSETYSVEGWPETWAGGKNRLKCVFLDQTYLDCASKPSKDGCFTFRAKDIRFSFDHFCTEDFCSAFDKLRTC